MAGFLVDDGQSAWMREVPDPGPVTIGRATTNAVVIDDVAASREHCRVERDELGAWWVVDLRSRNGTRVNGRLVEKAVLSAGDRIEIGATVITFTGSGSPDAAGVAPLVRAARTRDRATTRNAAAEDLGIDPVTGLASFPAAAAELRRELEAGEQVALLKVDLDHLGLLNDMFGLRAGDELIREAARALEEALEGLPGCTPFVAREAGGKFLVVLPGARAEQAREAGELVRARIADRAAPAPLRGAVVTASAGVAASPDDGRTWQELFRRAEAALAAAKRAGRDRTALARPDEEGSGEGRVEPRALARTQASGLWRGLASGAGSGPPLQLGPATPEPDALAPVVLTPAGQSLLGVVARALGADLPLPALLELALSVLVDGTGARRGFILLVEPSGALRLHAAVDRDRPGGRAREGAVSQGLVRAALEARAPVVVADAPADERWKGQESLRLEGVRSALCAPLLWGDEALGAVYLDDRGVVARFGPAERDLAQAFARLLAGPIRARSRELQREGELERARAALERTAGSEERRRHRYANIVGESAAMKQLFRLLDRLAESSHPVLIQGESGTGKELVAAAIHYNGPRRRGPFVAESCAALSDALLEAELFGHVRGAYTGADADRVGLIEAAHGGTLFLDELGEMSERMQAKLLRVLQEGELRPVGSQEVRQVDVRLIGASNRDLARMVEDGRFRQDLYYRVAVMTVTLPPLRERREDVPLLVDHLLAQAAAGSGRRPPEVSREAMQLLVHHDWPGNVRELENELKKLLALAPDRVEPGHLSPRLRRGAAADRPGSAIRRVAVSEGTDALLLMIEQGKGLAQVVESFEREAIERLLRATDGNRSETARRLGLSRPGLLKKMKRYGLS